jgi:hypothetical protein
MKISQIMETISKHFEISKEVLYSGFLHDIQFRIFVKSKRDSNIDPKTLLKELKEKHYMFMIDFNRTQDKEIA